MRISEHRVREVTGVLLPERRKEVGRQSLGHRFDTACLVLALDGPGGDAGNADIVVQFPERGLQRFQFLVALPARVGYVVGAEVVGFHLQQFDTDAFGGQRGQSGRRDVVHVGVALRVDRHQSLDGIVVFECAIQRPRGVLPAREQRNPDAVCHARR